MRSTVKRRIQAPRRLVVGTFAITMGMLVVPMAMAEDPKPASSTAVTPETEVDVAAMSRNLWWNQTAVVEVLELSDEQRTRMDQVFGDYLVDRRQARQALREGRPSPDLFRGALADADLEAARRAIEQRGAEAAAEATAGPRMMLAILGLLDAEQFATLKKKLPDLLTQRWFLQAGGDGPRRRPMRRPAQRSDGVTGPRRPPLASEAEPSRGGGGH